MKKNFREHPVNPRYLDILGLVALYLLPGLILILIGITFFGSAGRDDAHITYWPAYTLSHWGQILNLNGERVEQSSSLLQVLLISICARLTGFNIVTIGRLSSIFFGAASTGLTFTFTRKLTDRTFGFLAALLTALSPYFIYWAFGGLEATLVSFTGMLFILTVANYLQNETRPTSLWWAAVSIMAFEMVRPEAPLIVGCVLSGAAMVFLWKENLKISASQELFMRMLHLFLVYTAASCSIFAFRFLYFGDLFPQPVGAKVKGVALQSFARGIVYLLESTRANPYTIIGSVVVIVSTTIVLVSQIKSRKINRLLWLALLYVFTCLSFVILSGGDWMEGGRFLVPFLPVATAFILIALFNIAKTEHIAAVAFCIVLAGIKIAALLAFAQSSSTGIPLGSQVRIKAEYDATRYTWFETRSGINMRDVVLIHYLDNAVAQITSRGKQTVIIMSKQMGIVPYHIAMQHFGQVRFMDIRGLADRTFTRCEITRSLPRGGSGLELSYSFYFENMTMLEQLCQIPKPDIIFELNTEFGTQIADSGYTVIYSQNGYVTHDSKWLRSAPIIADQFIAVRSDLLNLLDVEFPVQFTFSE